MLKQLTGVLATCAALLAASASSADDLDEWLEEVVDPGRAAALYVWTPEGAYAASTGRFRPGGRAISNNDRFMLASVSKVYAAVALVKLAEQRRLDLDAPAKVWLPQSVVQSIPGLDRVSVRELLAMRSGIPEYYTDALDASAIANNAEGQLSIIHGERPNFAPGARYEYSNSNYLLAEIVLEAVTGQSFGAALDTLVFQPAGLSQTEVNGYGIGPRGVVMGYSEDGYDTVRAYREYYAGPGFADGGIAATASDVAKFYKAVFIDQKVLGKWGLSQLTADPEKDDYGLGIEVERVSGLGWVWGHSGSDVGYASDVRLRLSPPAIAVVLAADEDAYSGATYDMLEEY